MLCKSLIFYAAQFILLNSYSLWNISVFVNLVLSDILRLKRHLINFSVPYFGMDLNWVAFRSPFHPSLSFVCLVFTIFAVQSLAGWMGGLIDVFMLRWRLTLNMRTCSSVDLALFKIKHDHNVLNFCPFLQTQCKTPPQYRVAPSDAVVEQVVSSMVGLCSTHQGRWRHCPFTARNLSTKTGSETLPPETAKLQRPRGETIQRDAHDGLAAIPKMFG